MSDEEPTGGGDQPTGEGGNEEAFSFYSKNESGESMIRPEIAKVYEGEEHASIRDLMLKYKDNADPMAALSDGIKNLNFLARNHKVDHLVDLPDDAPESLKREAADLRRKITGAPENIEEYELKKPENLPENVYWPEGAEQKYMELAMKHGVSKAFLHEQMQLHTEMMSGAEAFEEAAYQSRLNSTTEALKEKFGHDYQKAVDMADRGMMSAGVLSDEESGALMKAATMAGLGDKMVEVFKWVGESISEDRRISSPGATGAGGESNMSKAKDIIFNENNPLHAAYHNEGDPRHSEAVRTMRAFSKRAHELGEKS